MHKPSATAKSYLRMLGVALLLAVATLASVAQMNPASQDTYILPGSVTNYGAAQDIFVDSATNAQGLVQFNLSGLPSGTTGSNVAKATLLLYVDSMVAPGTISVAEANGIWSEMSVNGTNAPTVRTLIQGSVPVSQSNVYLVIDVTQAVQDWVDNVVPNDGLMITPGSGVSINFDSMKNAVNSHPEWLNVVLLGLQGLQGPQAPTVAAGPQGVGGATLYPGAGVAVSTGNTWGTSLRVGQAQNDLLLLNASGGFAIPGGVTAGSINSTAKMSVPTLQVTSNSTAAEQFTFSGRSGAGFPVPYVAAITPKTPIAFDVAPTTGASDALGGIGVAWIDICDGVADSGSTSCASPSNQSYESLRLGIHSNGAGYIGSAYQYPGGGHPLLLQPGYTNGSAMQVGLGVPAGGLLYPYGGVLDITHNSQPSVNENSAISITTGLNNQPELLLGADQTDGYAYVEAGLRGIGWNEPLALNPGGGPVKIAGTLLAGAVASTASSCTSGNPYLEYNGSCGAGGGPAGPQGPAGPTGAAGPQGPAGPSNGWTISGSTISPTSSTASVGIGTTAPLAKLQVVTSGNNVAYFTNTAAHSSGAGGGEIGYSDSGAALSSGDRMGYFLLGGATDNNHDLANSVGILGFATENWSKTSQGGALSFATTPDGSTAAASRTERMRIDQNGNVGIGTTAPGQRLEVNGNAQVDGTLVGDNDGAVTVGAAGITFPNGGGTQTTAWTGTLSGGDYAEAVDATGLGKSYEPGDVLVISRDGNGEVEKSSKPYSAMVAGIYATKPGVIGRRQSLPGDASEIPMAMIGIVPTKVTTENGPIHRGDLLVTSSAPGYAMKGTDHNRLVGAVIGKAMEPLDSGAGVIEVLVTLQ